MDGSINFYRGWDQYKTGFGQASGEYWLGKTKRFCSAALLKSKLMLKITSFVHDSSKVLFLSLFPARSGEYSSPYSKEELRTEDRNGRL